MKPLNIKDRSKAFLKVVGLFLICFAIAMILGFTTMNAGRLTDSASNKDLKELRENNKFQEEEFAPEVGKLNQMVNEALTSKKQGDNIDQVLSDITTSISLLTNKLPEEEGWRSELYGNVLHSFSELQVALKEQVRIQDELENIKANSSGSGAALQNLQMERDRLEKKVEQLEGAAAAAGGSAIEISNLKDSVNHYKKLYSTCERVKASIKKDLDELRK